ncbi:excalibur calcium-binding domain-containing protein [Planotetraspora sp. A-T 1434]|uniref:SecDF P1 head subdomain-containing protein n=1 Tax=Planotetraspora sp. A-T 1434 TaxID=2979219 RepID=UPI0021BF9089|nr:excalibur calcium-binding domain-containing protein [Planotetraspora sp. A-T 1434]MCT9930009.1 excalibur calcium-binding domain-containing protein [Planotetraspora sp. A-T 1434]
MAGIEVGMQNAPVPGDEEPVAPGGAEQTPPGRVTPEGPPAPDGPQATRGTTVALVVALVLVVVMTGVLGAVAILMTRNPDAPPLSQTPVRHLQVPMHFAPVTGVTGAPCAGTDAIPDSAGAKCYQLDPGVTVSTVQKIEPVPERDGTYSIRLELSPSSRDQIAELTHETVKQQLAIVVAEKVVAAPRVAQEITQGSLSIAGFTKAEADALVSTLTGAVPGQQPAVPSTTPSPPAGQQPTTGTGITEPGQTQSVQPQPGVTQQGTGQPGTGQPGALGAGTAQPTPGQAIRPVGQHTAGTMRFATCKEATEHGQGPFFKGRHQEYYWYTDVDHDGVACDPDDLV